MSYGYVYLTTCLPTGRVYVGQRKSPIFIRWYLGSGKILLRAVKKYGRKKFTVAPLEFAETKELLDEAERRQISAYREQLGKESVYNISDGGNQVELLFGGMHPRLGVKLSAETRAKISASKKGTKLTEEHKQKISALFKGRKFTPEHRARIGKPRLGTKHSEETRAKLRAAWARNPNRTNGSWRRIGCKLSAEHVAKISSAPSYPRGPYSEERKRAISEGQRRAWAHKKYKGQLPDELVERLKFKSST